MLPFLLVSSMMLAGDAPAAEPTPAGSIPTAPATSSDGLPSVDQIEAKIAEVAADTALDEAGKAALTEQYRRALANLEATRTFDKQANDFAKALTTAPAETTAIRERLAQREQGASEPDEIPKDLPKEEIARRLSIVLADATAQETRVGELDKAIERNAGRPAAIRARLSDVKTALGEIDTELNQPTSADADAASVEARQWALETRRASLWAETRMLEQDLLSQSAREALNRAKREEAVLEWETLQARQRQLEELQNQRRRDEAEAAQRESERAKIAASDKHALVQEATRENAEITTSMGDLARDLDALALEIETLEAERKRVEQDFKAAQERIEAAGLSKALGQVLVERRDEIPDQRRLRGEIEDREEKIAEATLRQILYREEQRQLRDLDAYLDELTTRDPTAQAPEVREQLKEALEQRRRLITQALSVEDDYIRQLGELNYAADQLIQTAERYDDYLAERLLWVRSTLPVGIETLVTLPSAIGWLVAHEHWVEVTKVLTHAGVHSPLLWGLLLVVVVLFWKLSALRRAIRATAEPLRRIRTDRLRYTGKAIGLSLLAALPIPLLLCLIGLPLSTSINATGFTRALGSALIAASVGLYYLRAFRTLCITGGVADRHFRWSQETLQRLRREFDWFSIFIVPVALTAMVLYNDSDPAFSGSLGRLAMIVTMVGFSVFFARLLSPAKGVVKPFLAASPNGWFNRLRLIWFPVIVGAPLGLAVLALLGYVYTAGVLFESLVQQTWLALALIVLHQVIVRWLIVTRRRLALTAAVERASARRAQNEAERKETAQAPSELQVDEPEPNLAALDEQTRRLINASVFFTALLGVWLTWSDVLPALSMLERIPLWYYEGMVDGVAQPVPVTAANLGLVLLILFVATAAAKNLPALLEILLLQTESVSAGGRYAIKTLVSYGITVAAFLLAFSTLGLNWGQVQWLVAALGVGIGFGLQEIVANFISGIIILFERPVRVGDIVTIGDTTGVVTNIQIRATTIRNWDRQELLVPNKEFITGRLLNWSLTDQQNRITIPIGIEYGSDTRKALSILAQIAKQHERVLDDPAPLISFEGFGDNALTIVLRCYLNALEGRIGVATELHQAIYDRFKEEGIGMAFPQRDVHLSLREPLDIRLDPAVRDAVRAASPVRQGGS
ncbi:mechanosensitive ion channel domain-containing protein [Thiocapsa bogorovii]|uniref:mechanosensitive ion channel domain-containing protein n=1 Tax=Thiocapsa bogorovii TaxID=521689 RepID=UPI001E46FA7C|nr:mechanosensitive ion channel domain-containing protein [Thiocapsa bogorovii]UHD18056.1 mechanosensitive ion channel [Thiocapsa bogorovii]